MKSSSLAITVLIVVTTWLAAAQVTFTYEGIDPKDEREFTKKAEAGDAEAAYRLGFMYAFLRGHQNDAEAVKWLTRAAEKNHARAEWALGSMYSQGRGVTQSEEKSVEWFVRAAEHGSAMGQVQACSAYSLGRGVPKDSVKAFDFCKKAAEQGNVFGELQLGNMYLRGEGVAENEQEGEKWIAKAAAAGFGLAQQDLARIKGGQTGLRPGAPKNHTDAVDAVFITDNNKRDAVSQSELDTLLQGTKLAEDPAVAAILYQKAIKSGASPVAWYGLGRLYEQGRGVSRDNARALELLMKAAKQEYVLALYRLGEKYRDGDGVQQDNTSAYTWFALAARYGSEDGKSEQAGIARFLTQEQTDRAKKAANDWATQYPKIELGPVKNF
jgi:uncharacterized protein